YRGLQAVYGLPTFTDAVHGIIPVTLLDRNRIVGVTPTSSDGGQTWELGDVIPLPSVGAASASAWSALVVHSSRSHWVNLQTRAESTLRSGAVEKVDFLDENEGWIVVASGACEAFKSQC